MRYFFLREVVFGQDGSYSPEAIETRINADLANGLGNLAQRSLSMIAKGFDGRVPTPGALTAADEAILAAADALRETCVKAMQQQAIKAWLDAVWSVIADADRYFASEKPFDKALSVERKGTILYVTAEVVRQLAILVQPAMPTSGAKLLDLLGQPPQARTLDALGPSGRLKAGAVLPAPTGVFPRYVRPVDPDEEKGGAKAKAPKGKARKGDGP